MGPRMVERPPHYILNRLMPRQYQINQGNT